MEKATITLTVKPERTSEIKTKIIINVLDKKRKMYLYEVTYDKYENMYQLVYNSVEE